MSTPEALASGPLASGALASAAPRPDAFAPDALGPEPLEVRTEPFGGGALVRAALDGALPVDSWYPAVPTGPAAWRARAESAREQYRAGAWLDLLAPAFDARGAAAAALERVGGGAGVVVTTGQQPGLFGGPLYTLAKALSARALAERLEPVIGFPVAPVFWAATDDTDWEEGRRAYVVGDRGLEELALTEAPPDGTPVARAPLGTEVDGLRGRFARACGAAAYAPALDALARAYVGGRTSGDAYVQLLRDLFEPLGIAVLDASHPATRAAGFQLMRRALLRGAALADAVGARSAAIEAAGFRPQVRDVAGLALVFREGHDGRKRRLRTDEARALVPLVSPGDLAPNVLLRPVVERGILPTVAYVAGPGEYAYFAQVSAVADALAVPRPVAVPRWSGTVVEARVARTLGALGLSVDALRDPHAAAAALARRLAPAGLQAEFDALRAAIDARVAAVGGAADDVAGGDGPPLLSARAREGARLQLLGRVGRLERRAMAGVKRRHADAMRALAAAEAALRPNGARQERVLSFLPFLARYGPALTDKMLDGARVHADALVRRGPTAGDV
ncbi:putative cysteine ligase BshC [Gemmatimonadetes bacterium T265]|nr:putative cysteine ligase BshC [Gemmatimonadetes bacterium T265]